MNGTIGPLITSAESLPPRLAASVNEEERAFLKRLKAGAGFPSAGLPFAVTPHFASLAGPERDDPIRRQFFPGLEEEEQDPFALEDPLGEAHYRLTPRLVHQYPDRALLLAGGACAGSCRYCFRRVRMSANPAFINEEEIAAAVAALRPEVRELLVSGGDPLTACDAALEGLFARFRAAAAGLAFRVCTRVPVTAPQRITTELIDLFCRYRPLRLSVHINHPRELADVCRARLAAIVEAGIPVLVQTVLLRGVNDSVQILSDLFASCAALGLRAYYLFQLDLAPGTAHFRVPLKQGLALYQKLKGGREGPPLPVYAVDLPGGGGKIPLEQGCIAAEEQRLEGRVYLLRDRQGRLWPYPAEQEF